MRNNKNKPTPTSGTSKSTKTTSRVNKVTKETLVEKQRVNINDVLKTKVPLKCRNARQKDMVKLVSDKEITIVSGPAGCGKTYLAIVKALELIQDTSTPYSTLVLTKPIVEAEEELGFLPGDLAEKTAPHIASFYDILDEVIGETNRKRLVELGIIKVEALAFLRGKTMNNKILIGDELQNASPNQLKTLVTRIGANAKYILLGDIDQSDRYKNFKMSGLYDVIHRYKNIEEIGQFEFDLDDVVRNPLISKILATYKTDEGKEVKEILKS